MKRLLGISLIISSFFSAIAMDKRLTVPRIIINCDKLPPKPTDAGLTPKTGETIQEVTGLEELESQDAKQSDGQLSPRTLISLVDKASSTNPGTVQAVQDYLAKIKTERPQDYQTMLRRKKHTKAISADDKTEIHQMIVLALQEQLKERLQAIEALGKEKTQQVEEIKSLTLAKETLADEHKTTKRKFNCSKVGNVILGFSTVVGAMATVAGVVVTAVASNQSCSK